MILPKILGADAELAEIGASVCVREGLQIAVGALELEEPLAGERHQLPNQVGKVRVLECHIPGAATLAWKLESDSVSVNGHVSLEHRSRAEGSILVRVTF